MKQDPIFSVVVIAHDRREYLLDALKSISKQTLHREFFEVIIVKNFVDRKSDDYAKANNFELVLTEAVPVGAKMSIGVKKSKGKYIALLEDDDLFDESKLMQIYKRIEQDTVGFVHNSFELINEQGNMILSTKIENDIHFRAGTSFLDTCRKANLRSNNIVLSSCMTISKTIIVEHLEEFSQIEAAPDLFILISFINSSFPGIHMKERLTKYRLHRSQSNRSGNGIDFINKNLEIRRNWVSDYTIMKSTFKIGDAGKIAGYFFWYNSLFELVLQNRRRSLRKLLYIAHLLKTFGSIRYSPSFGLIFLGLLSIISPGLSHIEYYRYRRANYNSTFS